jgi:hypothetical protein
MPGSEFSVQAGVRSECSPTKPVGVPMTRLPLSLLIAVVCFIVMWFWSEPIVVWLTGDH